MSIHFISGKPGGGKSLYGVRLIVDELIHGHRTIVTNVPLLLGKINEYIQLMYPAAYSRIFCFADGTTLPHITERIILINEDELSKFFTFRGGGVRLESVSNAEWKSGKRPDYSLVKDGGVFYVLDEVHIAFNSRAWADTGAEVLYYLSQHRKLGDDVICITQSVANVDKQFRSVAQDFTYLKNLSKQKVGLFRLPAYFTRNTYPQPATDTSKPMESGTFSLDVSGIASLYDTARGVGIHGRSGADTNSRKKGLHWAWVIVGLVALGFLLKYLPTILNHIFSHNHPVHDQQVHHAELEPQTNNTTGLPHEAGLPQFRAAAAPPVDSQSSEDVYCIGYSIIGGSPEAYLSDGSTVTAADGLETVGKRFILFAGRKLPIHSMPMPDYVPQPVTIWPQPPASPPRPVNQVDILPAIHSRFIPESPRLNGFNTMHPASQPGSTSTGTTTGSPPLP